MVTKVVCPGVGDDSAVLKTAGTLMRALENLQPVTGIHPHHILLELDDDAKQLMGEFTFLPSRAAVCAHVR
jgi:hypothetical protein